MSEEQWCILVVEDDADTLKLMARLLDGHGYCIRTASTVEEAEDLADGCGLLVSDIGLGAEGGLELMRDLKLRYGMKGIAVSGHAEQSNLKGAADAGFDRFIAKPVSVESLLKTVEELMTHAPSHP